VVRRIVVLLIGLSLVAVSCGSSGAPSSYEESVEDFYLRGCNLALADDPQFENVAAVCQCAYDGISAEIAFEDFEALNNRLRDDVGLLSDPDSDSVAREALVIISNCIKTVPAS